MAKKGNFKGSKTLVIQDGDKAGKGEGWDVWRPHTGVMGRRWEPE